MTEEKKVAHVENDHIKASYSQEAGCKVLLDVVVKPTAAAATYDKAIKNVKKEVVLPGFRKGKVPEGVVQKNFASHIDREFKDLLCRMSIQESVSLTHLNPLSSSSIRKVQVKKSSRDGAEIHFEYECEPKIPEIDIASLSTKPVTPKPITDDDIDHELMRHRIGNTTFEEITDRPVEKGDFVEIDVDIIENPASNLFTNRLFHVMPDEMPEWCYNLVLGMNTNENKEVTVSPDFSNAKDSLMPQGFEAKKEEAPKQCRVLVTAIKKGTIPELTDEFAQKFQAQNATELKGHVRRYLEAEAQRHSAEISRAQLVEELLHKYPLDLPSTLFQAEEKARYHHIKDMYTRSHGALPNDAAKDDEIKATAYFASRNFLTAMYLLNPVAQKLTVNITSEDLLREISYEAVHVPPEQRIVFPHMEAKEAQQRLGMRIFMRYALDHILEELGGPCKK